MKIKSNQNKIKRIIYILVFFLVLVSLFFILKVNDVFDNKKDTAKQNIDKVNYNPPTSEEKQQIQDFKTKQASEEPQSTTQPGSVTHKTVIPTISSWGQDPTSHSLEAAGFINGVVESSGTCTLVITKGSETYSQTASGVANAQNTVCPLISIPRSKIPSPGEWSLKITYESKTAKGTSEQRLLKVE